MALGLAQFEELDQLARRVPALVDLLESRQGNFAEALLDWLRQVEAALEHNRMAAVSQVSVARAMLIQAARGQQFAEVSISGRVTPRKLRDAAANLALLRCNKLLQDVTAERRAVFQEAERFARQLLTVAEAKGLLERCRQTAGHQVRLECIRQQLMTDPDLASPCAHLTALVGKVDALVFLDRALPP